MPILVQKLIFDMTPAQWPFFIRPLVSMIFTQLENQLLLPEIQKHTNMVSTCPVKNDSNGRQQQHHTYADRVSLGHSPSWLVCWWRRTNCKSTSETSGPAYGLIYPSKAADFQMHFPLEALVSRVSSFATPRMMGYVKQVQDRYGSSLMLRHRFVLIVCLTESRPAYKRVIFSPCLTPQCSKCFTCILQALRKGGGYSYAML
jgi:hypothetical protein